MKTTLLPAGSPHNPQHLTQIQKIKSSENAQAYINLVTKEGDQVTIQHSVNNTAAKKAFESYDDVEKSLSKQLKTEQFTFDVKGDLNETELNDLANLLNKLSSIASDFFSGDMGKAVAGALDIGDMGSVGKLEASFSHTSVFSSHLKGYHPLPPLENMLSDQLLASHFKQDDEDGDYLISDILKAQWEQFFDYFKNREIEENEKSEEKKHQENMPDTAKTMFAEAQKTITNHPRLTPLIPNVADLAVKDGLDRLKDETPVYEGIAESLLEKFNDQYKNWII